ncbi:MAG: hypothetical protein N4A33_02745 [Bacteriovoracaceae bacterium]|jgi:hypothetical protein|nr:hypothetical protein [Bacteriovoracaceae bacterium]
MKKIIGLYFISSLTFSALASEMRRKPYPKIYPFVPLKTKDIHNDVKRMSEDKNALINIFDMYNAGLLKSNATKVTPWVSTYWPLNKGGIADPYHGGKSARSDVIRPRKTISWRHNYNRLKNRYRKDMANWSEAALSMLSPSEKYDLLLGDESFDLTNKVLDYMYKWGSKKEYGFLKTGSLNPLGGSSYEYAKFMFANKYKDKNGDVYRSVRAALSDAVKLRGGIVDQTAFNIYKRRGGNFLNILNQQMLKAANNNEASNYVLKKKNDLMALWEGICNGWSTAAGIVPRPLNSFEIELHTGKKLKFYPEDVKALISLYWFNSFIQNSKFDFEDKKTGQMKFTGGTLMQGKRCNEKSPKKDEWGRFYDSKPDAFAGTGKIEARCVGVHPAIWHMSLVNLIGKQKRSFIVERKIKAAVDNHPMSDYSMTFFNPYTGNFTHITDAIKPLNSNDVFRKFRNKNTKYLLGVKANIAYIDWKRPVRYISETEKLDIANKHYVEMMYDLELDSQGNIIGGQWRATKKGKRGSRKGRKQPDFFWVVTKDWKKSGLFEEKSWLEKWKDTRFAPPKSWLVEAKKSHALKFEKTHKNNWNEKCEVIDQRSGKLFKVPCEFEEDKPQPLLNVINKLIELSRK